MSKKKKVYKLDKRTPEQKILDTLKNNRRISREIQLESGIKFRSAVFKDKTKYDRKRMKDELRKGM